MGCNGKRNRTKGNGTKDGETKNCDIVGNKYYRKCFKKAAACCHAASG